MKKFLLLNGPNINLLGQREPHIYGTDTLQDIESRIISLGNKREIDVICFQSNKEGELIDKLHAAFKEEFSGVIFNPGAFTHYSYALRDAIAATNLPTIEVHISNVHTREAFRHTSVISPVTIGQVVGFGTYGYEMAFLGMIDFLKRGEIKEWKS